MVAFRQPRRPQSWILVASRRVRRAGNRRSGPAPVGGLAPFCPFHLHPHLRLFHRAFDRKLTVFHRFLTHSSTPMPRGPVPSERRLRPRSSRLRRPSPDAVLSIHDRWRLARSACPLRGALGTPRKATKSDAVRTHRRQPGGMVRAPAMSGCSAPADIAGARALQPFTHTFARITRRRP